MHYEHWYGWGNFLIWIVGIPVIIFMIWYFIRLTNINRREKKDTPLEILKRRYARGEISKQEFEERKKTLSHSDQD